MKRDVDSALDDCLALLRSGQATLGECLARYPDLVADLRPLLETAIEVSCVPLPSSSPADFAAGKHRMLQALAQKKRRQSVPPSPFSRYVGWIETLFGKKERTTMQKRTLVFQFALATATLLVLLIAGGLLLQSWMETVVTQVATLADVSGVVEVLPAGGNAWQLAGPGRRLTTGDRIRTGDSSAVTLAFFDGSTTSLASKTELTVSQLSARRDGHDKVIVLHQWIGRTYNRVQRLLDPASRFEIETPTAVTAVRGTVFVVEVMPDGTTKVTVGEGFVEVIAQGTTVEVQPGQATVVQPDLPPAPAVLAPTPLPPVAPQPVPTTDETPAPAGTKRPGEPTQTPAPAETPEPTEEPPEPTEHPEPTEEPPAPTDLPEPTEEPPAPTEIPEPTEEPPAPTEPPELTEEPPEPTDPPEPTEEPPEPTEEPDNGDNGDDDGGDDDGGDDDD